jgi:polyisoprenoid-binding protein YceI
MKHLLATAAILASTATMATAADSDPSAASSGHYAVEPVHTRVQFSISHLGLTNWYGDFTGVTGSLNLDVKNVPASTVDISIPVASISTTNAKLDGELKSPDWFNAAQYPTIHFVSTKVEQTAPNKALITGNLTFHGVTKTVVLAASFNGAGINPISKAYTVGFDGTTTIRRSDFGVSTYLGLIGDETTLRISAGFEKAS